MGVNCCIFGANCDWLLL